MRTSHWFHAYKAVRFFPHPAFFPVLEKQFKQALNKHIVISDEDINIAIASYQDKPAMALLKKPIFSGAKDSEITNFYQARFCALKQVSIPFYTPLFWEIWEKELILDKELWTYLSGQDPKRALALAKHSLNNIKIFFEHNFLLLCEDTFARVKITTTLVDTIFAEEPELVINLINTFIEKEDDIYKLTELLTKKAGEIKHPSFVQTLLTRLEKKTQYYDYRHIVRALLAYKDNDINKKLKETIQSYEHLANLQTDDNFKVLFIK